MEMIEKNQEGVGEQERVDAEEEEEDLVFEVDIAGDGDCFYSSIVEAFSRSSADLSDEVFLTKSLQSSLRCCSSINRCRRSFSNGNFPDKMFLYDLLRQV